MRQTLFFSCLLCLLACSENPNASDTSLEKEHLKLSYTFVDMGMDSTHFRGLDMLDINNVWIGGTNGTALSYNRSGWFQHQVSDAKGLDLRDVEVLDSCEVVAITAGSPCRIFKTNNCGKSWEMVYENTDSLIFYDGFDFWGKNTGMAFGDPINGKLSLLKTTDGGSTWQEIDASKIPDALPIEAGFAASGTSIQAIGDSTVIIGLGGENSRVFLSQNQGEIWEVVETPMLHGSSSRGIYSLCFKDGVNGVAVGGNWENPHCDSSKIYTTDGGKTWQLSKGLQAYRSCVTHIKDDIYLSTGTSGTDISYDNGRSWQFLDSISLNAIQFDKNANKIIGVGSYGKIAFLELK